MKASISWRMSLDPAHPARDARCEGLEFARSGGVWVAIHGWLYNYNGAAPVAPLLARAFREGGTALLTTLRGGFVLAIGDEDRDEVIVARDPLGAHPLFRTTTPGRIEFAESTQALRKLPFASQDFNRAALADHLCHRWPDTTETFFKDIKRVPAGSAVRLTAHQMTVERYWDPARLPDQPGIALDCVQERFEAAFIEATRRCLSHGRAGVFLSGGLDSISVAAAAADAAAATAAAPPIALSLAMGDPSCDERSVQTQVATALRLPFRLVEFHEAAGPDGLVAEAAALSTRLSAPLLNTWAPAYVRLAGRAAADGVGTILSGSGGDEWLAVSPYLSADLIARGDALAWWRFFSAFERSYSHSRLTHAKLALWTFGGRPLAARAAARVFGSRWQRRRIRRATGNDPRWISPDPRLRAEQLDRVPGALEDACPPDGFYVREMRSALDHPLASWELEEQYEFGLATNQRFVHPYWDPDVVDVLYKAPPGALLAGGRAKGLVRGAMARRFPATGLERQKKVSGTSFFRSLVRASLPRAAARLGECSSLRALGVIDGDAARRYAAPGFCSPSSAWDVVNLESWVRAHA